MAMPAPTVAVAPLIGVVGGVGPYAGLDLVRKIFDQTLARNDQEHLPVALLSLPAAIPDRTEYLLGRSNQNPAAGIARVVLALEHLGVQVAAIPCNTAHANAIYEPVLQVLEENHCRLKLLHLIRETILFLKAECGGQQRIGVLSTTGTYQMQLYARPLAEAGFRVIVPTRRMQEEMVHPAIYHREIGIKARSNPVESQARQWLDTAVQALKREGAEVIILGCTELPLAITEHSLHGMLMIDPATILARALIREVAANRLKPLPSTPCPVSA